MTAPNVAHQSGHARAFIDYDPMSRSSRLYVMQDGAAATFTEHGLVMTVVPEGVSLDDKYSLMAWSDHFEDSIIDMFKAVAKALEIYSDDPGVTYKQGFAEGESKVLREWNESLRG